MIAEAIHEETCLACGYHVAVSFLKSQNHPLATIAWPEDENTAQNQPRLPLDFVRCVNCGHVYNAAYDCARVPYSDLPSLMFNQGAYWVEFIKEIQKKIVSYIGTTPEVVEIGHGDGSFLGALAALCPKGSFIGFDPHATELNDGNRKENLRFCKDVFDPIRHFDEIKPDIVISRHVLEHLTNPLGFLQRLSFAANYYDISPLTYFEVPCIDRALETGRTVDFYYEHSSQFTSQSFTEMLKGSTQTIKEIGYGYDSEVIYSISEIDDSKNMVELAQSATQFYESAEVAFNKIKKQLKELHDSGQKVAVWGGTGKSCSFMCRYGVDNIRFPIVIDSDKSKVGTFVPGMGQEIRYRDWLYEHPVDVVVIPPQWRARDIVQEMENNKISYKTVLIEHEGMLVDFHKESHPYRY